MDELAGFFGSLTAVVNNANYPGPKEFIWFRLHGPCLVAASCGQTVDRDTTQTRGGKFSLGPRKKKISLLFIY
jgi:hypothetical protein